MLNKKLLELLRCPLGKAELKSENEFLVCSRCGVKFPVRDDIPVLLIDDAILPEGILDIKFLDCQNINK